jgi:Alpha/beta hydrolase domain
MLLKRPIDPRKFSGTVVIEALNPGANFDIAAIWDRSLNYFVRNGDVLVGWTSKSVTVNTPKTWNPTRNVPLNRTYAPFTPGNHSGVYDGITFDIAAQLGALFKQNGPLSPLRGLNEKHVFEAGFSQDGSFTFTQADIFNALERMPNFGRFTTVTNHGTERSQLRTDCRGSAAARRSARPDAAARCPGDRNQHRNRDRAGSAVSRRTRLSPAAQRFSLRSLPAVGGARRESCLEMTATPR